MSSLIQNFRPIALKTSLGVMFVEQTEIKHIEADRNNSLLLIIDQEKPIRVLSNLNCVQIKLSNRIFIRCHRSHIINKNYVRSIHFKAKEIILCPNYVVPASDNFLKEIRNKISF